MAHVPNRRLSQATSFLNVPCRFHLEESGTEAYKLRALSSRRGRLAAAIPGARCVEIPAAGYLAPLEQPLAVGRALTEFLESLG
jgi:hypothetical protein